MQQKYDFEPLNLGNPSKKAIFVFFKKNVLDKESFLKSITNPSNISGQQALSLKKLVVQYPYAGILQGLYAKGLQNTNSYYFDNQLRKAAVTCSDRNKLYELLYQNQLREIITKVEDSIQEENDPEGFTDRSSKVSTNGSKVTDQIPINKEKDEALQKLEKSILIEAIDKSIQLDVDQLTLDDLEDTTTSNSSKKEARVKIDKEIISLPSNQPKKYSDWLFSMKPLNGEDGLIENEDPKDLINNFIALEDKSIKMDKGIFTPTPQQLAKISLVENESFVTETLAKVHASQGNYQKAIKIYEQLKLKNPEKKTFFASRIRFLQEKIEYDKG